MSNYDTDTNVVRQVQTAINGAGYQPPLTVDGVYGPNTAAGVTWFQGVHGLTQDGVIGDQTVAATIAQPPNPGTPISPLLLGPGNTPFVPPVNSLPTKIPPAGDKPYIAPPTGQSGTGPKIPLRPYIKPPTGQTGRSIAVNLLGIPAAKAPVATGPGVFVPPGAVVVPAVASSSFSWAGTAFGLLAGLGGGYYFGHLAIGGAAGGVLGAVIDILRAPKAPAPVPMAPATMHGETPALPHHQHHRHHSFAGFGMDVNMDDTEAIIAGDMGCAAPARALRG